MPRCEVLRFPSQDLCLVWKAINQGIIHGLMDLHTDGQMSLQLNKQTPGTVPFGKPSRDTEVEIS